MKICYYKVFQKRERMMNLFEQSFDIENQIEQKSRRVVAIVHKTLTDLCDGYKGDRKSIYP